MEILQFLLSLLNGNGGFEKFAPIIELLKNNSFNLSQTLQNLNLQTLAPILQAFMKDAPFKNQNPTDFSVGNNFGLNPITPIADKEIVYSLNKFFYS